MRQKLAIVFENDEIIAINKPAGLLTIPDRAGSEKSLKGILQDMYGEIFTIHRLDKDTSGLVLFAKNEGSHKYFSALFMERKIQKFYLGIVHGSPQNTSGIIEAPLSEHPVTKGKMVVHRNGKPAITTYQVIEANRNYSLLSFELLTGRTHQIRVHAMTMGHALACDELYGDGKGIFLSAVKKKYKKGNHDEHERPMIGRLALHSHKLIFDDQAGKHFELVAESPKEFKAIMNQLRKTSAVNGTA